MRKVVDWRSLLRSPRREQERLASSRPIISKEQFVDALVSTGARADVSECIWELVASSVLFKGFSPYPDDSLLYTLGIAEEELEIDMISDTCRALALQLPSQDLIDQFGPIETPRHVALLISRCVPV